MPRKITNQHASVLISVVSQYSALGLGLHLSWAAIHHRQPSIFDWLSWMQYTGVAVGLLLIEICWRLPRVKTCREDRQVAIAAALLVVYSVFLIQSEPFVYIHNDFEFVTRLIWLAPYLASIIGLSGRGAWLGILACIILFAVCLGMLSHNMECQGGQSGFFHRIVY